MPLTSVRTPRRLGRLIAGLSVAAAATAGTLLTAATAEAATPVQVRMLAFGELSITGSDGNDNITVSGVGSVLVQNSLGSLQPGPGCEPDGAGSTTVQCAGAKSLTISGRYGDDTLTNSTSLPGTLFGGGGNDQISGGFGNDYIGGNVGGDVVDGRAGIDTCFAEVEFGCEK